MKDNFLNELNDAQKEAVVNAEGPALVIAGAGAGKTRVLTYRIAWLLMNGVRANRILALTFTNKAAAEMKNRIASIAGPEIARFLWMGTFHSVFAKILRIEGDRLGYKSSYTIYDTSDSKSLIRSIIREMNLADDIYKPGVIASRISHAKNNLITASMYSSSAELTEADKASRMPLLSDIYKLYSSHCFKSNAMDFDDLLLNTNILLRDFPDVLADYQQRFDYILVDEYQDTNYAQYLIIKKLAAGHRNLCVVGDDAQSIYSFRGARIENIFEFRNDYPEYKLFKLEQNFRSTQTIVNAANGIIANNSNRIHKVVFSKKEEGEKIRVLQAMTDTEEGFIVSSDIFDARFRNQLNWSDFAILYRTNAQSRIFEETLRKKNIPYRIYGGLSFYERKEIKDILSYLRMVINPEDEEALKRTINYPKRGIGDTTVGRILEIAAAEQVSPWNILLAIDRYPEHFNGGTRKKLSEFRELIKLFQEKIKDSDAYLAAREISAGSGMMRELREGKTPEEVSRFENFEELMNAIQEFTQAAETNGEPATLEAYMQNVALLTDQDTDDENDRDRVTLMTMHSAKGLEFSYVYITGMEDNLFPSPMSSVSPRELEEERRLFYVALTRAEKMATLTFALNRYKWGNLEHSKPSRFLKELGQQYVEYPQSGARFQPSSKTGSSSASFSEEPGGYVVPGRLHKLKSVKPDTSEKYNRVSGSETISLSDGDTVIHERFGTGLVLEISGEEPNTTALVDFENGGKKKLLLRFAKLKKI
ncbi:MAG TPA: UvrD-helicase domain-containing protein [Bacteroidales bacterium]|nr:UvrD-helicase domain-containing protein [Bacteroidales bacterium]